MPLYFASTFKDPLFITIVIYVLSPPVFLLFLHLNHLLYHHWSAVSNVCRNRGITHSSFSASTSSSLTSNPCSYIEFITAEPFCIDGAISLDPVLISSSPSLAFSHC